MYVLFGVQCPAVPGAQRARELYRAAVSEAVDREFIADEVARRLQ